MILLSTYMSSKKVSEDSNLCTCDLWTNKIKKTKKTLTSTNKPTSNVKTPTFQQPHAPHTPTQKITTPQSKQLLKLSKTPIISKTNNPNLPPPTTGPSFPLPYNHNHRPKPETGPKPHRHVIGKNLGVWHQLLKPCWSPGGFDSSFVVVEGLGSRGSFFPDRKRNCRVLSKSPRDKKLGRLLYLVLTIYIFVFLKKLVEGQVFWFPSFFCFWVSGFGSLTFLWLMVWSTGIFGLVRVDDFWGVDSVSISA